jgi:hypothetical protein
MLVFPQMAMDKETRLVAQIAALLKERLYQSHDNYLGHDEAMEIAADIMAVATKGRLRCSDSHQ